MSEIKNFVLTSDYMMDYIVWKYEGSFTATDNIQDFDIPHGMPFTPLVFGIWSTDPSFAVANTFAPTTDFGESGYTDLWKIDQANVTITMFRQRGQTIYVRLLGLRNPDYDGNIEAVQLREDFRKNSDFNYPKIYSIGKSTNNVINHGLGYIPQARLWWSNLTDGGIMPAFYDNTNFGVIQTTPHTVTITDSQITFQPDSGYGAPYYFVIFGDNGTW